MARKWIESMRDWMTGVNDDIAARTADWLSELTNKVDYESARELTRSSLAVTQFLPSVLLFSIGLTTDARVPMFDKLRIGLVATQLIRPAIPVVEILLGPIAVADDVLIVVLLLYFIADLMRKVDEDVLMDNWVGDPAHGEQVVELCRALRGVIGSGPVQRIATEFS